MSNIPTTSTDNFVQGPFKMSVKRQLSFVASRDFYASACFSVVVRLIYDKLAMCGLKEEPVSLTLSHTNHSEFHKCTLDLLFQSHDGSKPSSDTGIIVPVFCGHRPIGVENAPAIIYKIECRSVNELKRRIKEIYGVIRVTINELGYDTVCVQHANDATRTLVLIQFQEHPIILMSMETLEQNNAYQLVGRVSYEAFAGFRDSILPSTVALPQLCVFCAERCVCDDHRFADSGLICAFHHLEDDSETTLLIPDMGSPLIVIVRKEEFEITKRKTIETIHITFGELSPLTLHSLLKDADSSIGKIDNLIPSSNYCDSCRPVNSFRCVGDVVEEKCVTCAKEEGIAKYVCTSGDVVYRNLAVL